MNPWAYLILLAALVAVGPVLITHALAGKPESAETEAALEHFARLRALPETTAFDPPADLPRARLRSVPVQGARHLRAVDADQAETDAFWDRYLTNPENPFVPIVPQQRDGGSAS